MFKKITLATAAALLLSSGVAVADDQMGDRKGAFEFGFSNVLSDDMMGPGALVGGRYWASDKAAVSIGVGFESQDAMYNTGTEVVIESGTSFAVEGAVTIVVKDFGDSFFFVKPSVNFTTLSDLIYGGGDPDADDWTAFTGAVGIGGEVTINERFGLSFEHGFGFTSLSPGGDGDSLNSFGTFGANATEAAVHFRFN